MAKKKKGFRLTDKDWLPITKALVKKQKDGTTKIESLWHGGECPFCGTDAVENSKGKMIPAFMVDNERLHFRCLACSFAGGPMNYCMVERKCTLEESVKFLKSFVR